MIIVEIIAEDIDPINTARDASLVDPFMRVRRGFIDESPANIERSTDLVNRSAILGGNATRGYISDRCI
ncbi:hypothetical protein COB72_06665 [bacterium]|nr:MAG: hypothetical protein COB72_06665 [bacterium]